MARNTEGGGLIEPPDFEKMKRIFAKDIKPADEKTAKSRGDLSTAWKAVEEDCRCNKKAAKLLFKMNGWSEEELDAFLRTLYGGMEALGLGIREDMVDQAEGHGAPQMPIIKADAGLSGLATLN